MKESYYKNIVETTLLKVGGCYVDDLKNYLISCSTCDERHSAFNSVNYALKTMEDELTYRDVPKFNGKGKRTAFRKVVMLNSDGQTALLKRLQAKGDKDAFNYYKSLCSPNSTFNSVENETLERYFSESKILLYMQAANISYVAQYKPCLYHLYYQRYNFIHANYQKELDDSTHLGSVDLSQPIYYAHKEYVDFVKKLGTHKKEDVDHINSSRFRGIIISKDNLYVVYQAVVDNRKLIKVTKTIEKRLYYSLKDLAENLGVIREVACMNDKDVVNGHYVYDGTYENDISAIILCDEDVDVAPHIIGAHVNHEVKVTKNSFCLSGITPLDYQYLFVVPYTTDGFHQLDYIAHISVEQYHRQCKAIALGNDSFYTLDDGDNPTPMFASRYDDNKKSRSVLYLPVYEAKTLCGLIKDITRYYCIITHPYMFDTISRALREKECPLFDIKLNKATINDYLFYDELGHVKGEYIIKDILKKKGKDLTRGVTYKLPKMVGLTFNQFYNTLCFSSLNEKQIDDICKLCPDYKRSKKVKKHLFRKRVVIILDQDEYEQVKEYAQEHRIAVSRAVKHCFIQEFRRVINGKE